MKKIANLLLALTLTAGLFAGCNTASSGSSGEISAPEETSSQAASSQTEESVAEQSAQETPAGEAFSQSGKLVVGLDDQFPPMGYRDEAGEIVGFDVDLAKAVGERLGLEVVLQPINWAAKEMELANGNVDVLWNGLTITAERQEAMLISPAYLANAQVILVKADSGVQAKTDLAGKSVALQTGSSADEAFNADELKDLAGEKIEMDDNVMALNDLEIGRVDAVVLDKIVADYYMAKKEGVYRMLTDELAAEEYGIAFKKGNQELYDMVTGELNAMVEDGTAKAISEEWFGEDRVIFSLF